MVVLLWRSGNLLAFIKILQIAHKPKMKATVDDMEMDCKCSVCSAVRQLPAFKAAPGFHVCCFTSTSVHGTHTSAHFSVWSEVLCLFLVFLCRRWGIVCMSFGFVLSLPCFTVADQFYVKQLPNTSWPYRMHWISILFRGKVAVRFQRIVFIYGVSHKMLKFLLSPL